MNNQSKVIAASICVGILICAGMTIYFLRKPTETPLMTAMTKLEKAIALSNNWTNDATLTSVRNGGKSVGGKSDHWTYYFISPSTVRYTGLNPEYDALIISIYATGEINTTNSQDNQNITIVNWTIDSDKAYKIFSDEKTIKSALNKGYIIGTYIILRMDSSYSTNDAIWDIRVERGAYDPRDIRAIINAKDGTIIKFWLEP
jgi:hypothetical protein